MPWRILPLDKHDRLKCSLDKYNTETDSMLGLWSSPVWSNYMPTSCLWPAGRIQKKSSNLKFVEKCEVIFFSLNCLHWINSICTGTMNNTFAVYHFVEFILQSH